MSWSYRIMKRANAQETYEIVELYVNVPGSPGPLWTEHGARCSAESLEELKADLALMMRAFDLPVLDEAEMEAQIRKETEEAC